MVDDRQNNLLDLPKTPRLVSTYEGASAFPVDDPFARLVFNYGSFLPETSTFYGTPEKMMADFIDAVEQAGRSHPELALQYAAWLRDPRKGKGNRSQPPWVIAVLASLPQCAAQPRFAELVARCVVRPDDALNILLAASKLLGDNPFPPQLKQGLAQGLDAMSDYQLTKYANARLNLLPEKRKRTKRKVLTRHIGIKLAPTPTDQPDAADSDPNNAPDIEIALTQPTTEVITEGEAPTGYRSLRLVDALGLCKKYLSPRLFALYRYLHAPTREQAKLLPALESYLPLLGTQKLLRMNPPREVAGVAPWVEQALQARMTMEQMFSATGMAPGQRQQLLALTASPEDEVDTGETTEQARKQADPNVLAALQRAELAQLKIRAELWKTLVAARVADEDDPEKILPFLGDTAFLRNVRGMYQTGVPLDTLVSEAGQRQFSSLWPFQILAAAQRIKSGGRRGAYAAAPCPQVMPVLDVIFEKVALSSLPRKSDGTLYRVLGLADLSGSMSVKLGSANSSATCMDAAVSFSAAFSFTTRGASFGGLAGSWDDTFHAAIAEPHDGPLTVVQKIYQSGGWGGGGTQVFGSMMALIRWLLAHPEAPRPEVLVVLSDMQFHPPSQLDASMLRLIPPRFKELINRREFKALPPLAAAIVLYREILGSDISLVLWNLASYEGSPAPSNMERMLLLSGFDTNSFRIIEQWLQAGSPGSAMPISPETSPAGTGESGSSIEAVLAALRRY